VANEIGKQYRPTLADEVFRAWTPLSYWRLPDVSKQRTREEAAKDLRKFKDEIDKPEAKKKTTWCTMGYFCLQKFYRCKSCDDEHDFRPTKAEDPPFESVLQLPKRVKARENILLALKCPAYAFFFLGRIWVDSFQQLEYKKVLEPIRAMLPQYSPIWVYHWLKIEYPARKNRPPVHSPDGIFEFWPVKKKYPAGTGLIINWCIKTHPDPKELAKEIAKYPAGTRMIINWDLDADPKKLGGEATEFHNPAGCSIGRCPEPLCKGKVRLFDHPLEPSCEDCGWTPYRYDSVTGTYYFDWDEDKTLAELEPPEEMEEEEVEDWELDFSLWDESPPARLTEEQLELGGQNLKESKLYTWKYPKRCLIEVQKLADPCPHPERATCKWCKYGIKSSLKDRQTGREWLPKELTWPEKWVDFKLRLFNLSALSPSNPRGKDFLNIIKLVTDEDGATYGVWNVSPSQITLTPLSPELRLEQKEVEQVCHEIDPRDLPKWPRNTPYHFLWHWELIQARRLVVKKINAKRSMAKKKGISYQAVDRALCRAARKYLRYEAGIKGDWSKARGIVDRWQDKLEHIDKMKREFGKNWIRYDEDPWGYRGLYSLDRAWPGCKAPAVQQSKDGS
jgi:hypothetical protein